MARQSLIKKSIHQQKLFQKFHARRLELKRQLSEAQSNKLLGLSKGEPILQLIQKLQRLPKNSSKSRLQKRCFVTGKAKKCNTFASLSRHSFREFAKDGRLPGLSKSSW